MADAPVSIKTGNIASQTIHTREKIGNLCKRLLCYIVDNKKSSQSIKDVVGTIGGDTKKVVDLIFILESLGMITRISKNTYIYTGFRGMIQRLCEFVQNKIKKNKNYDQNIKFMSEDLSIGDKGLSIKSSLYLGKVISTIVFSVLLDTNKTIQRGEVDSLFEEYSQYLKDSSSSSKNIVNDMINLLIAMNLVEKNDSNDNLVWSGPDCINSVGLNNDNIYDVDDIRDILKPKNINYEAKELTYFKNVLKDEISSNRFVLKSENFAKEQQTESYKKDPNSSLNLYPFSSFEIGGYAFLKGKTWQHLMTKPYAIIGRCTAKDMNNKKYKWEVDVNLVNSPSVSRQHAVILYNYEDECFEIKCLSKKNPVKVGDYSYDCKDKACPLESKSLITLGGESFYFFLPNLPSEKPMEIEKDKKEEEKEGSIKEEEEEKGEGEGEEGEGEEKEIKEEEVEEERIKLEDEEEAEQRNGEKEKNEMEEEDDIEDDDEDDAMEIEES